PDDAAIIELSEVRHRKHSGLVLFSSGSSGKPKGVVNDLSLLLGKFDKPGRPIRAVCFLLFDHIGGFNTLMATLASGGAVVCVSDRSPLSVCREPRHRADVLPTSPTFLNLMLVSRTSEQCDLSSLQLI